MTTTQDMDILLGIGFGDVLPDGKGVLARLLFRTDVGGSVREGVRPPLVIKLTTLEELAEKMPRLLPLLREHGLDHDRIAPAKRPIPWNEGPTIREADGEGTMACTVFGFLKPDPSQSGPVAYIEVEMPGSTDGRRGGSYAVMPHRAVLELAAAIPKVVAQMKEVGEGFDFAKLGFQWDAETREVRLDSGYLGRYLRQQGVTTPPRQQDMMELMTSLYVLHRKQGRPALAVMEAFLEDSGIRIKEHDPATISPARRQMDASMDSILMEAHRLAREGVTPEGFWQWLDAQIGPVEAHARAHGEGGEFEARYGEVLQLAKDASLARAH